MCARVRDARVQYCVCYVCIQSWYTRTRFFARTTPNAKTRRCNSDPRPEPEELSDSRAPVRPSVAARKLASLQSSVFRVRRECSVRRFSRRRRRRSVSAVRSLVVFSSSRVLCVCVCVRAIRSVGTVRCGVCERGHRGARSPRTFVSRISSAKHQHRPPHLHLNI